MTPQTVTGVLAQLDHVATSDNLNPTYRVRLTDGRSFLTETDGSVGYRVPNHRLGEPVVLTVDRRGRVIDVKRPDGTDA